jgi:hypothetical protein
MEQPLLTNSTITITLMPTPQAGQFQVSLSFDRVQGGWIAVHQALTASLGLVLQKIVEEKQPLVQPVGVLPKFNGRQ